MKNFTLLLFLHFLIQNSVFAKVVQVCTGDVTLASQAEVDAFNCEEITGTLTRLNPIVATIQLVNVVPRLDPNNTPSAFRNVIVPASTNANTSSDTTELLCTMAVSRKPPLIALGRLCVYFRKNNLNALPDKFFSACSISVVP